MPRLPPMHRDDHCGCPKGVDAYGQFGWHFRLAPGKTESGDPKANFSMCDVAYERCPRYMRAVHSNKEARRAA